MSKEKKRGEYWAKIEHKQSLIKTLLSVRRTEELLEQRHGKGQSLASIREEQFNLKFNRGKK